MTQRCGVDDSARPQPRRIVIVGNAGSGKTTLARRIAERFQLDALELDEVRWEQRPNKLNSAERCREVIREFTATRASWVIEGLHATLLELALVHATELHFLNPGFEVCRSRALARPWDPRKSESPERQAALFREYEPWFRSYDTRTDETSLAAHRALFETFDGAKWEHTAASADLVEA
jgi:adenylate kinase family enzyme